MKISDEEFKTLFHQELMPRMDKIETLRHHTKIGCFYLLPASVMVTIIVGVAVQNFDITAIVFMIISFVSIAFASITYSNYYDRFKTEVVRQIVDLFAPDWQTFFELHDNSTSTIERKKEIYNGWSHSHLTPLPYDSQRFDDHIRGQVKGVPFQYTEIILSASVKNSKNSKIVFQGMFLQIDFEKHCIGKTFINPQKKGKEEGVEFVIVDEPAKGFFGKDKTTTLKPLYIEHTRFDRAFLAYSTNPNEPNEILNPALLDALCEIAEVFQKEICLSFVGNRAYCIIKTSGHLFEAELMKTSLTLENAQEMYDLLTMAKELIRAIKTHARVWNEE